ncbi:hypothetical protein FA15DRAFT_663724 [Coprinopsis marcescibilis]|uniref:RanBD1 domain-containing protein n=1 Tax=Coprinopsis marcescibilis TaxID=230819 RepID=A0A5C3LAE3_COPMA|nr:hypothetical protein FA15DRAFT_663724 [Coprinopsis marcescibilis]
MADDGRPQTQTSQGRKGSPTPSPPALDTGDAELKLSRKREREVSLEPATPSATEVDAIPRHRKDSRTPAKKNRRHLDTTVEEDDGGTRSRSNSVTPPISISPPQEMKIKVRQISQGVEDLSWLNRRSGGSQTLTDEEMVGDEDNDNKEEDGMTTEEGAPFEPDAGAADESVAQSPGPDKRGTTAHAEQTPYDNSPSPDKGLGSSDTEMSKSVPDLHEAPAISSDQDTSSASRLRAYSESGEKGVKRKYLERGTSQGPQETAEDAKAPLGEVLKRPRDEADQSQDRNGSPPPQVSKSSGRTSPPSPKVPKLGGFMAYASSSSPFASVKGKNLFASSTIAASLSSIPPTPVGTPKLGESSNQVAPSLNNSGFAAFSGSSSPFASVARVKSPSLQSSGISSSPPKRSGFEAFNSSSSPFASAARAKSPALGSSSKLGRAKSPPRKNNSFTSSPFASYAAGMQSFAAPAPAPKRVRADSLGSSRSSERGTNLNALNDHNHNNDSGGDSDEKASTFGERLRAGKDDEEDHDEDEQKVALTEQEVTTGEEEEETVMQVRGKLFSLQDGTQWKERGTGILKINVKREDGSNPRLVMRKDAVYTLLLNVTLFPGMHCTLAQDPRYLRFSVIEDGKTTHYNLRVSNAKIAQEFLDEINANIPLA